MTSEKRGITTNMFPFVSFIDATVDLGDVEQRKEQILTKDALVSKLSIL